MRRLENEDEDKFWEAWIKDDLIFCYRFGKLGSSGHTKIKKFKSRADAEAELEAKLAEKIEEGFAEIGGEEAEDGEAEDGEADETEAASASDEAGEDDSEDEDDDASGEEEESGEDDSDGDDEDDSGEEEAEADDDLGEEEAEADDDSAEDEDDDGAEDEDEDADEDEAPAEEPQAAAPEPEQPKLPARYREREPSRADFENAEAALEALGKALGGRSWKLARKARLAARALERLAGKSNPSVEAALGRVLDLVIAQKKQLPLGHALRLLAVVDAKTFVKSVKGWRTKMLKVPGAPTIGVLATLADSIDDPELALATGLALADRELSPAAWQRRFAHVRPVLLAVEPDLAALAKKLRAETDPVLQSRVKELSR
jgi:predicted DNA-binding WGR domain protein